MPARAVIAMNQPGKYRVVLYDINSAFVYRNVDFIIIDDVMDVLKHAEDEGEIPNAGTHVYQINIMPNNNNAHAIWYYESLTLQVFNRVKAMLDHSRNRGRHDHSYDRDMDSLAACVSALRLRVSRLESECLSRV